MRFGWSIDEIVCRFSQAKVTLMAQMWEMGGVDSSHCCKLHLLAGKHLQQVFKNHKESGIKKHHQQTYHTGPNWFFSYIVLHISIPRTEDDPCPPPSWPPVKHLSKLTMSPDTMDFLLQFYGLEKVPQVFCMKCFERNCT